MAAVDIVNVAKRFGAVEVLAGVDAAVAHGEMLVILGASGCGKTTLLRLIAGLEQVTAGEIRIGGRVVNDVAPKDRDIAMVFQNYALYPHMTVYDNMAYALRNRGTARGEIDRRVRTSAHLLGLDGMLHRRPRHLSGGQRQRVAMGRAIVREPAVFLFDEPLSNLDAALRSQMRVEIRQLQRRLDTTGIFVTHDQVEAMTVADRILLMNQGRVEQIGPPLELYRRPATTYVASFIGAPAMNLLDGRLDDAGARFAAAGIELALPAPRPALGGRAVVLGVRPEDLHPVAPSRPNALALPVALVERLGADQVVFGRLAGTSALVVRLPGATPVAEGETLTVAPDPGGVHLFDPADGRRLDPAGADAAA